MIADAVLNAAGGPAGQKLTRTLIWFALAAFMFTVAAVSSILGLFWYLEPQMGSVYAALVLAVGGFLLTLLFAFVPSMMSSIEAANSRQNAPLLAPLASGGSEAPDAVDYFGAAKVLISAFLLGLGAARSLKGR